MSKFFEALEQAERERAMRPTSEAPAPVATPAGRPTPAVDDRPPVPVYEPAEPLDEHLVSLLRPNSFEAEQYRILRHMVEQARRTTDLAVVGISSPTANEGKTLTAINLAGALAQAPGTRVLLIDFDLRKPDVARRLLLELDETDLIHALLDPRVTLDQVVRPCPPFNLSVLAGRRPLTATYEVLKSPRCGELIEAARARYDYVVVDLPPLIPIPDCRLLEKWLDGFLIVVAAHKTPRKVLEIALAAVDPAKLASLVFNGDDDPLTGYGYGYGSSGDEPPWWRRMFTRGGQRLSRRVRAALTRSSAHA